MTAARTALRISGAAFRKGLGKVGVGGPPRGSSHRGARATRRPRGDPWRCYQTQVAAGHPDRRRPEVSGERPSINQGTAAPNQRAAGGTARCLPRQPHPASEGGAAGKVERAEASPCCGGPATRAAICRNWRALAHRLVPPRRRRSCAANLHDQHEITRDRTHGLPGLDPLHRQLRERRDVCLLRYLEHRLPAPSPTPAYRSLPRPGSRRPRGCIARRYRPSSPRVAPACSSRLVQLGTCFLGDPRPFRGLGLDERGEVLGRVAHIIRARLRQHFLEIR